ncbi:MAG: lyase family protein [Acidobacteria bacterium]|nr:lyase family protein [Acidobacteriota bacterium]
MTTSPFDSAIYRELLHDAAIGDLFSDAAVVRAMMQVEGALARVQGRLGAIPAASARAIDRGMRELQVDPTSLATGTRDAGIPAPVLVATLRDALQAPEHAHYLHWGATSQDIMDTGLVLRLRGVCDIVEQRLTRLLQALARQAETHAELPLAARTRAQIATPTSFGAVVAAWGAPLLTHLEVLAQLRPRLLRVSLAGASGNAAALGDHAATLRAELAVELALGDSGLAWHSDRAALVEFAGLLVRIGGSLAKLSEDCIVGCRSEIGELKLAGGGSSTMPQKQNPVIAETIVSLFRVSAAMSVLMQESMVHREQRDGVAWALESHALPTVCMASARALALAIALVEELHPDPDAMLANLCGGQQLVFAEAISFELARTMPRPQAQAEVKRLCADARQGAGSLVDLVERQYPDVDWRRVATPAAQLGDAPRQAARFVELVGRL